MRKINLADVPEEDWQSPKGKFQVLSKEISVALGRERDSLDLMKRHPFDLELSRVPPGKTACPYHAHSAQFELYLIVAGEAFVRDASGAEVKAVVGDALFFPPGEAHQIRNEGPADLLFYVIADNPLHESCYYPDSGKWAVRQFARDSIVTGEEIDYLAGEE